MTAEELDAELDKYKKVLPPYYAIIQLMSLL